MKDRHIIVKVKVLVSRMDGSAKIANGVAQNVPERELPFIPEGTVLKVGGERYVIANRQSFGNTFIVGDRKKE